MKKALLFLPLGLLLVLVIFLAMQLKKPDAIAPSEDWRGKPFPEFRLPSLLDSHAVLSKESFPQEPFVVNVWASWCTWCIKEFPQLLELKEKGVKIIGLTYADRPENAKAALEKWGNPFTMVIDDSQNDFFAQALNVNSAPISYLVDHKGIIRYQQKGFDPDLDLVREFQQRLEDLRKEMK